LKSLEKITKVTKTKQIHLKSIDND